MGAADCISFVNGRPSEIKYERKIPGSANMLMKHTDPGGKAVEHSATDKGSEERGIKFGMNQVKNADATTVNGRRKDGFVRNQQTPVVL